MIRLATILFPIIATTLAGLGIIVVLVSGYSTLSPILGAAGIGAMAAFPVTGLVVKKLY